mmetsp:Transcript_16060/g.19104  ORF Transcript_16060/g.19104 Transcript_16060/m.19104 type:complete len:224 (+) Transcript_16060:982-1653(+)
MFRLQSRPTLSEKLLLAPFVFSPLLLWLFAPQQAEQVALLPLVFYVFPPPPVPVLLLLYVYSLPLPLFFVGPLVALYVSSLLQLSHTFRRCNPSQHYIAQISFFYHHPCYLILSFLTVLQIDIYKYGKKIFSKKEYIYFNASKSRNTIDSKYIASTLFMYNMIILRMHTYILISAMWIYSQKSLLGLYVQGYTAIRLLCWTNTTGIRINQHMKKTTQVGEIYT